MAAADTALLNSVQSREVLFADVSVGDLLQSPNDHDITLRITEKSDYELTLLHEKNGRVMHLYWQEFNNVGFIILPRRVESTGHRRRVR